MATAGVVVVVATAHLVLSAPLPGPSLLWDGTAYLSVARWLAGEATPYLGHLGHYSVGYPLLLVPVVWATSSLDGLFDGARLVNAAAIASTVPALALLGERLGGLRRTAALAIAAVAALLPAVAVQSGFEWAESVFAASVVWSAVAALAWAERPTNARAVVLALASAGCYLVHPRGLAVAVATLVVLAVGRQRVAGAAVLVAALAGAWLLNRWAVDTLWNPAVQDQSASLVRTITTPSRWDDAARRGAGQLWYGVVATVGLAAFGALRLVTLARQRPLRGRTLAAGWIVVGVVATFGVAVTKLAAVDRPDQLVYGRYLDPWLVVLTVLGAGAVTVTRRLTVVRATGALAVAVLTVNGTGALEGVVMPLNILGALAFDLTAGARVDVAAITALALIAGAVVAVVLTAIDRHPALVGAVLAIVAVGAGASVAERHVQPFAVDANGSFVLGDVLDLVDEDAPIAYDMAVFDARGTNRYQLANRDRRFTFFDSRRGEVPAHDLVVAGKDLATPPAPGARPVFPEPHRVQVLWVLAGPLQDELAARGYVIGMAGESPPPGFQRGDVEVVGVRDGRVEVRVTKGDGGAPWLAPGTLPAAGGEVALDVTVAGRTTRARLSRTVLPGDEARVLVALRTAPPPGTHDVRVRLVSPGLSGMPEAVASLRFP